MLAGTSFCPVLYFFLGYGFNTVLRLRPSCAPIAVNSGGGPPNDSEPVIGLVESEGESDEGIYVGDYYEDTKVVEECLRALCCRLQRV